MCILLDLISLLYILIGCEQAFVFCACHQSTLRLGCYFHGRNLFLTVRLPGPAAGMCGSVTVTVA